MEFRWLSGLALFACLMSNAGAGAAESETRPLNVLLIMADDLRDHLGCYGQPVKTPNIDRLASRSVRFDRAYAQYPVCNPSRCSLLSGLRPDQTKVVDNATQLRASLPQIVTLPQLFKQHGYYTAAYGKVFHVAGRDTEVRAAWMDLPFSWHESRWFSPTSVGEQIAGRNLTHDRLPWCYWGAAAGGDDDQPDGQVAQATVALIERLGDQPWFVAAGFYKPHDPFVAPQAYFELYPPESLEVPGDPADMSPAPSRRWDLAIWVPRFASSRIRIGASICARTMPAPRTWTLKSAACSRYLIASNFGTRRS
jgi:uncharacterized sulfatase